MKRDKFIIGTRGSQLAQIYTEKVINDLKKVSSTHIETKKQSQVEMKTKRIGCQTLEEKDYFQKKLKQN